MKRRRRFSKVRFKRKLTIALILIAIVLVCFKSCAAKKPDAVEASPTFTPETVNEETTNTGTYKAIVHYPVQIDDELQQYIIQICSEHQIDPAIVMAMIQRESRCNADAIGDDGESYGLMQIQPGWHYGRMNELGCHDLLDPYQNVTVGVDFLAELLDYGNGLEWALMAYNGGQNDAYAKQSNGIVTEYVQDVFETAEILTEGAQTIMSYRTDDPIADFDRWDAELAAQEAKLPRCDYCDNPVQDDHFYLINDEVICPDCLDSHFRKGVDDYVS